MEYLCLIYACTVHYRTSVKEHLIIRFIFTTVFLGGEFLFINLFSRPFLGREIKYFIFWEKKQKNNFPDHSRGRVNATIFPNCNDRLPFSLSQWKGETSKKLQFEHTCSMFDHVQIEQRAGQSWPEMPALLHSLDIALKS